MQTASTARRGKLPRGVYVKKDSPYFWIKVRQRDPGTGLKADVYINSKVPHVGATRDDIRNVEAMRDRAKVEAFEGVLADRVSMEKHGIRLKEAAEEELRRARREVSAEWYSIKEAIFIKHVLPHFGERTRLKDIGYDELEAFVEAKLEDGYAEGSVQNMLAVTRTAFQCAYDKEKLARIPKFPFFEQKVLDRRRRQGFLRADDYKKLQECCAPSLRPLVSLLYWVGVRKGEALALQWDENVYFGAPGSKVKGVVHLTKTKNGRERQCPMYGDLYDYLKAQKELRDARWPKCPYVFFWHGDTKRAIPGTPIRQFRDEWARAREAAGLNNPPLLVHDLRRSAVTNLLQHGNFTEQEAMDISGHVTDSMLKRYQITRGIKVEQQAAKLEAMYQTLMGAPEAAPEPPPTQGKVLEFNRDRKRA